MNAADVSVEHVDDDTAAVTVTAAMGLTVTEAAGVGHTATFTVVLTSEPLADVVIGLSSSDTTEGTVSPAFLTFTAANWYTPQTVTITGVDDAADDADVAFSIVTARCPGHRLGLRRHQPRRRLGHQPRRRLTAAGPTGARTQAILGRTP